MIKTTPLVACLLLTACMGLNQSAMEPANYDFGSALASASGKLPGFRISAEVSTPTWLANKQIHYRLAYSAPERVYTYTQSRWMAPPAELLARRWEQVQAGSSINAQATSALDGCRLDIHLDDFEQAFSTPTESVGQIRLQAVIMHRASGRRLLQSDFAASQPAASADAHGGVIALTAAGDIALHDLADWLNKVFDAGQPEGREHQRLCSTQR